MDLPVAKWASRMSRSTEPTFSEKSELTHHIDEAQRYSDNRPAPAAFQRNPGETYLSVNSLEVEKLDDIARYYQVELQKDSLPVAICVHKVAVYNDAGQKAGARIVRNRMSDAWEYVAGGSVRPAYKHRPVPSHGARLPSPSHSGVEFLEILDELAERKFARLIAKKRKFHVKRP